MVFPFSFGSPGLARMRWSAALTRRMFGRRFLRAIRYGFELVPMPTATCYHANASLNVPVDAIAKGDKAKDLPIQSEDVIDVPQSVF